MSEWLYSTSPDNSARFIIGERGENPLVFIGVNPSRATPEKLDATLTRSRKFALNLGYSGWVMINLYPQRATLPANIHKRRNKELIYQNQVIIQHLLHNEACKTFCAAWGDLIESRAFLKTNLLELARMIPSDKEWIRLGSLTRKNHPRHPSRLSYNTSPVEFDLENYCIQIG